MHISRRVGQKGQVVIPEQIRREVGIFPGSVVYFDINDGNITVKKQKNDTDAFHELLTGIPNADRRKIDIEKVIGEQYEERLSRMLKKK